MALDHRDLSFRNALSSILSSLVSLPSFPEIGLSDLYCLEWATYIKNFYLVAEMFTKASEAVA